MEAEASKVLKIFYCYARKDKPLREEMDLHLSTLKRLNHVITWADHEITPGEDWANSIDSHLNDADIIFLLVSPNFMGSDYCYGIEMRRALERHEQKQARVIPIILRPVDWEDAPFSRLQVLPTNALPVTSWADRDAAFADIVKNLRPMIKELRNQLKTKEDWLAEAEALIEQDRHEDALAPLNHALTLDPKSVTALIYRGGAYKQLRDYKKALADFDRALLLAPMKNSILMLRGDTYRLQGDYTKALADLNQAIAIKPDYATALARRGETYRLMENYEKALVDLDQALALAPDDTFALTSRGDTHRFIGNYEQALADFDHALSLKSTSASTLVKRGDIYRLMKDYKKAMTDFNEALTLNPTFSAALARRGDTYRLLGEYEKALADLNEVLDRKPEDAWALATRGETYQKRGQLKEALADLNKVLALDEDDWDRYKRAIIYFLLAQKEAYEKDLIYAIKLAQSASVETSSMRVRWAMAFNIALYYLFLGKSETAEALYGNLVSVCILPAQLRDAADDLLDLQQVLQANTSLSETSQQTRTTRGQLPLTQSPFQKDLIDRIHQQILRRLAEIEQAVE